MNDDGSAAGQPLRLGMLIGSAAISGGGVVEAVRSLAIALNRLPSVSVEVFALYSGGRLRDFGNVPVHPCRVSGPVSFGYARGLVEEMRRSEIDMLHVHGLWMYISVAARQWAQKTGKPYVVSPHGMLDPWALANAGVKKRLARLLYEDAHLRGASCVHALCAAEADAIRAAKIGVPVVVVPNGVDLPSTGVCRAPWREVLGKDAKVLLFLGRVTEKKRVLELVRAFRRTWRLGNPWHLAVIGPAESEYRAAIAACVGEGPVSRNIHLIGPAYGDLREMSYASADAFILPSVSEGLPMAALEAFANGLPALLTPQCNLPEAFACDAAIKIGADEDGIAIGLRHLFDSNADAWVVRGCNARRLASETFSWDLVAERMASLYRRQLRVSSGDLSFAAL